MIWRAALLVFLCFLTPLNLSAATLHAILVGDSLDEDLRIGILADLEQMTSQVITIADQTGMQLNTILISEEHVTVENIAQAIKKINVDPDDAILLYFSGHGFRLQEKEDRWPYLFFNPEAEGLDFLNVCQHIKKKKPRMLLAIADCCNSFIDIEEEEESRSSKRAIAGDRKKNYQKLFLNYHGTIMVSSSIPGQPSVGNDEGGLFTQMFLIELNQMVARNSSEVAWDKLLSSVSNRVVAHYPQNPQFELQK